MAAGTAYFLNHKQEAESMLGAMVYRVGDWRLQRVGDRQIYCKERVWL